MSAPRSRELAGRECVKLEGNGIWGPFLSNAVRVGGCTVAGDRRCVCRGRADLAARTFANYFRRYFSVRAAASGQCGAAGKRGDALPPHEFILDFDGRGLRALAGGLADLDLHRAGSRASFGLHVPGKHRVLSASGAVHGGAGAATARARPARDVALRHHRSLASGYHLDLRLRVLDAPVDLRGAESAALFDSRLAGLHWRKYYLHLRLDLPAFLN